LEIFRNCDFFFVVVSLESEAGLIPKIGNLFYFVSILREKLSKSAIFCFVKMFLNDYAYFAFFFTAHLAITPRTLSTVRCYLSVVSCQLPPFTWLHTLSLWEHLNFVKDKNLSSSISVISIISVIYAYQK